MFEKFRDFGNDLLHHQLMNGGRKFACRLWTAYPDQFSRNQGLGRNMVETYWNNMCDDPPPPKFPPFEGGQCPVVYDIFYREGDVPGQMPSLNSGRNVTSARLQGPLTECSVRETVNTAYLKVTNYVGIQREAEGGHRGSTYLRKLFIVRADNQPDLCGNPAPVYPPTTPPQPGQESYDAPITNNDGTDFTVPLGWFNIDFNLPLTINVGPPQLDFTMELNVDGIDLNFGPDKEFPDGTPKPSGPGGEDKLNDKIFDNTQNTNDKIDDVSKKTDDILDKIGEDYIDLTDYTGTEQPAEDEAEEDDPEVEFIIVDVIGEPKKGKTILFDDPNDNVYFAGYFHWMVDAAYSEILRIRKASNVFVKPYWATGYKCYAVNGTKFKITSYKKKLIPPEI